MCSVCHTQFGPDQVVANFPVDGRTRDSLSRICADCLAAKRAATARRANETAKAYEARKRADLRDARVARTKQLLDEALPARGIPLFAFNGYPASQDQRTPAQAARLTWLYGKLRDWELATWEQVAEMPKHKIKQLIGLGDASIDVVDEHLASLGLPPLKP
jgi:hypothetical protein